MCFNNLYVQFVLKKIIKSWINQSQTSSIKIAKGLINEIITNPKLDQIWIRIETNIIKFLAVPIPAFNAYKHSWLLHQNCKCIILTGHLAPVFHDSWNPVRQNVSWPRQIWISALMKVHRHCINAYIMLWALVKYCNHSLWMKSLSFQLLFILLSKMMPTIH